MPPREDGRPHPEALLARLRLDEERERGGRLKIFFGANAGVGKTYAMLEEARLRKDEGVEVVVGYAETHGRQATDALLEGLEILPRRTIEHRGIRLSELDVDAALARRPQLILVDELAHTNAPGSRHAKRWQDVQELLGAGIDVYTTVNTQHIESLNDLVARITGVRVRETVPDAVFDRADEVELVDISPEELLKRLSEGKVYLPDQAQRALQSFFTRPNLTALRQIALRQVADRVDTQMQVLRRAAAVPGTWPVTERILVGVGPAPSSRQLVRATKRMADRMGAEWIALFVETPEYERWPEADRARVWETLKLAEQLGGRTDTVTGRDAAEEMLDYARVQNVGRMVVGKPSHSRLRDLLFGSMLDQLVRRSGDIDVYVITGEAADEEPRGGRIPRRGGRPAQEYAWVIGAVALCTAVAAFLFGVLEPTNVAMLYLLTATVCSVRLGRGPSALAAVLSVAAFDFFFVAPRLTFAITDSEYLITFGVMLSVALVISTLTARLRDQSRLSRSRERRTAALYQVGRDLVEGGDLDAILHAGTRRIAEVFEAKTAIYLPDPRGVLRRWPVGSPDDPGERAVAAWAFANRRPGGAGTETLPGASALYLPLAASSSVVGILGVSPRTELRFADPEELHFLETFTNQLAIAVERARLAEEAARTLRLRELDRMRNEFVAVAAQELGEPLARIEEGLGRLEAASPAPPAQLAEVHAAAAGLRSLVDDLVYLSSLQAGQTRLSGGPIPAGELLAEAVARYGPQAESLGVDLQLEADAEAAPVAADRDAVVRILGELLTAAIAMTPSGGRVLTSADRMEDSVQFSISMSGVEIPIGEQPRVFDAFVPTPGGRPGGLGLTIARELVRALGGEIWIDSGPGPGAVFSFTLPHSHDRPGGHFSL